MDDSTIVTDSAVGKHLDVIAQMKPVSYLVFNKRKIKLVAQITIGRDSDNNIVLDNKLVSRHHAMIQKIKDAYFLKDLSSTNGTYLNGKKIPSDKYIKLNSGDMVSVGSSSLVIS
ncbi:MAG: FHA domain-containing protein [Treponema sp.]|nr:FHA domain-containing protein [Treponema sp.]